MVMTTRRRTLCSPFSRGRTLGDGGGTPAGPSITVQPSDSTVKAPAAFTMSVTATGLAPLSYQWYEGNAGGPPIAGQTGTTLSLVTAGDVYTYEQRFHCVVTDAGGRYTRSRIAVVTITPAGTYTVPSFTTGSQPQNVEAIVGTELVTKMFATASGNPAPAYQWQERLPALTGTWTDIQSATPPWDSRGWAGETSTALSLIALPALSDNGREFRCKATNSEGTAYSGSAYLIVTAAPPPASGNTDCVTNPTPSWMTAINYTSMPVSSETGAAAAAATRPSSHVLARVSGSNLVSNNVGVEAPLMYDASGTSTAGTWSAQCSISQLLEGTAKITFSWAALAVTPLTVRLSINDVHMEKGFNGIETDPSIKIEVTQSGVLKATKLWASLFELNEWKNGFAQPTGPYTLDLTGLANENLSTMKVIVTIYSRHNYSGSTPQTPVPVQWITISDIIVIS